MFHQQLRENDVEGGWLPGQATPRRGYCQILLEMPLNSQLLLNHYPVRTDRKPHPEGQTATLVLS